MTKYWIGVASREHVLRGVLDGICQVCHGKPGPLKSMTGGDWIVYYSPVEYFGGAAPCRKFTAIGRVVDRAPYQFEMSPHFIPWRRDVCFSPSKEVPIQPLIETLSFILDKRRWGYPFRRGCFSIPVQDFALIASQMGVEI